MVKKLQKGFSLLEVACVIFLMGVVGLAAIPSIRQVRRQELNSFSKTLCLDLANQRSQFSRHSLDSYSLELIMEDGDNRGYKIIRQTKKDVGGGVVEVKSTTTIAERKGNLGFKITIMDNTGHEAAVTKLIFEDGKVKNDFGQVYDDDIIIKIENGEEDDRDTKTVSFHLSAGTYTIS